MMMTEKPHVHNFEFVEEVEVSVDLPSAVKLADVYKCSVCGKVKIQDSRDVYGFIGIVTPVEQEVARIGDNAENRH